MRSTPPRTAGSGPHTPPSGGQPPWSADLTSEDLTSEVSGRRGTSAHGTSGSRAWDTVFTPLTAHDPEEISGYPLRARIGEGGMGAVYLSHTPGGRPLAVKVVRPEFAADPDFRARFAKEVAIAQRVQGPYTVPVIDADPDAVRPWIATAYVPAPSLAIAVARTGALPATTVLMLIAGVAEALQSIHRVGVIHRDLKPGNVILAADGPRVIDFGVARALDAATAAMTQTGARLGTPAFMAPEQVRGAQLDRSGDVFALGATAYYAMTGRPPFGVDAAVFHRIEHQQPDWDDCPPQVRDVLARCLEKDPARRPTPTELIELCRLITPLGQLASGEQPATGEGWLPPTVAAEVTRYHLAPLPIPPPAPGPDPALTEPPTAAPAGAGGAAGTGGAPRRPGHGRRPWLVGAIGAVAFVVVCALAALLLTRSGEPSPAAPMVASAVDGPTADPARPPSEPKAGIPGQVVPGQVVPGPGLPGPGAPPGGPGAGSPGSPPTAAGSPAAPLAPPPAATTPRATAPQAPAPTPKAAPSSTAVSGCPGSPGHGYNGDGYGVLTEATALRSGPYAACGAVANLAKSKKVWLHCSVVNGHNNLWWWARLDGSTTAGWIYDGDLELSYVDDNDDGRTRIYSCDGTYVNR
ncbi:serine/threonine-protein kinase [Parafrankia discariae]|uniref:serine/threonine-protein kinase n=1 Tax=Parafrankia discariae TaxID=365528 RepID=UPI0003A2A800|nr:serine/threonine-protein kinase [Parafrankia discariae]